MDLYMMFILFGNIRSFLYMMRIASEVPERLYQDLNLVREVPIDL